MHSISRFGFCLAISLAVMSLGAQCQGATQATQANPSNGHTYHLLAPGDYAARRLEAQSLGGKLATINDAAEDAWEFATFSATAIAAEPTDAIKKAYFIGLNDEQSEGTYLWDSGEPVTYTNWLPGQPENGSADEDYAGVLLNLFTPSKWHDIFLRF